MRKEGGDESAAVSGRAFGIGGVVVGFVHTVMLKSAGAGCDLSVYDIYGSSSCEL